MQPHQAEQQLTRTPQQAAQRRFQIEKLEERIAPAKGGIPGRSPDHEPPGHIYNEPGAPPGHNCHRGCDQ